MVVGSLQFENVLCVCVVYKNEYILSKWSINDLFSVEQDVWQVMFVKIMVEYDGWSVVINYVFVVDNFMMFIGVEKNVVVKLFDLS